MTNFKSRNIKCAFQHTGEVPGLNSGPVNDYQCLLADVSRTSYQNIIPFFPVHHSMLLRKQDGVQQFCLHKPRIYWHHIWLVRNLTNSIPQALHSYPDLKSPCLMGNSFSGLSYVTYHSCSMSWLTLQLDTPHPQPYSHCETYISTTLIVKTVTTICSETLGQLQHKKWLHLESWNYTRVLRDMFEVSLTYETN
jgi:hypothetical protein